MSKKSVIVLIILLVAGICTISASDVMISWDWKDFEYSPLYSRYQLDGTSSDGWTQLKGSQTKVYFEVDTSVEHDFYIETTYDGWVWSKPSIIPIPKKETSFSAKIELDQVDLDLLFEKNRVSIDLGQSLDTKIVNDFFAFFAKKTKIDSSEFNLNLDSNKIIIDSKDTFYQSDVRLLKMLINTVYDEWQAKVMAEVETVSPTLETEIVEDGCRFIMTVKDESVTITCEHGFSLDAFQSLSEYLLENLDSEEKDYTYQFTSNSVVFSYPNLFNRMNFEEIKNTVQPIFHAWFVEYNELEIVEPVEDKTTPAVEPVEVATTDLKQPVSPVIIKDYPLPKRAITLDDYNFEITFMDDNEVDIKGKSEFSPSLFKSFSEYLLKNLDLDAKDFTYYFTEDSVVISYPDSYNTISFDEILSSIKPLFHTWYVDLNKKESEVVAVKDIEPTTPTVLLNRELNLDDYLININVDTEKIQVSTNKAVSSDALESLIGYMVENFKLNPADYSYSLAENLLILTYPESLKEMNLDDVENQVISALYDWYFGFNNKEIIPETIEEIEIEPVLEPPVSSPEAEVVPEKEEPVGKVDSVKVETVKHLGNIKSLSVFYAAAFPSDWNLQNVDQSLGLEFSQNFFKGDSRFGLGYLVGLNYAPNASLIPGRPQDTYMGLKTGVDASYAIGEKKNFFLSTDLGLLVSWSKTDILNMNFTSPAFGAFVGVGLKFAINKNIIMGLKFNFNRYF